MTDVLARSTAGAGDATQPDAPVAVRGPAFGVLAETLRLQSDTRDLPKVARILGLDPLHPAARIWFRGARGALRIADALDSLGDEWMLLHTVTAEPTGREFHHLLVGPTGAFAITVKDHTAQRVWVGDDTILVNGHRTDHARDARREAAWASSILSTTGSSAATVVPVVVIIDPASLTRAGRPNDLLVVASDQLARTLTRRARVLSRSAVRDLARRAEEAGPFRPAHRVIDESTKLRARFSRLADEVDAARRRRLGLASAAAAVLVAPVSTAIVLAGLPALLGG